MPASVWLQFDQTTGDDTGTDDTYEGFIAPAESIDLLLIVEGKDMYNRSHNMTSIRLGGSITLIEELVISLAFGTYSENEDGEGGPGLGTEIDAKVEWSYSPDARFMGMVAFYTPDDNDYASEDAAMAVTGKISVNF